VQRRIQGALLDLQDVFGVSLDGMSDGVSVRRPDQQRLEDEHVERALEDLDSLVSGRHSR
jgi:hypothetical protein